MKKIGDAAVAITVVACSLVLLLALAFALQGNPFKKPSRTLRAKFADITGIQTSSLVKYAGAHAGTVLSIRMLTPEERASSSNPAETVEVVLALEPQVPALNDGLVASVASDTLLSDKFVQLSGGDPRAAALANGAIIPSISPVTFDALLRDLNETLDGMNRIIGSADGEQFGTKIGKLMEDVEATVAEARALIGGASTMVDEGRGLVKNGNGLVDEADLLVADGRGLLADTREPIKKLIDQLSAAVDALDDMARRADALVKDNEGNINASLKDARQAIADLKVAAAQGRELIDSLKARPQQLIWGPGRQKKEH